MVDAEGIVAAAFRQHTSRAADPQLHTHLVIANRVRSPDGRWLALDARTIKHDQRTLSALVPRRSAGRAHPAARGALGGPRARDRRDSPTSPRQCGWSSRARTGEVQRRVDEKLDRFADTMGREPTARERWRLEREAVVDSRPPSPKPSTLQVLHAAWADQTAALGLDPARRSWTPRSGRSRRSRDRPSHRRDGDRSGDGHHRGAAVDVAAGGAAPGARRRRPDHQRRRGRPAGGMAGRRGRECGGDALCRPVPPRTARCAAAPGRAPGHRVGDRSGAHHPGHPRPGSRPDRLGRPAPRLRRRSTIPTLRSRSNRRLHAATGRSRGRRGRPRRSRAGRRAGRHRQDRPPSTPAVEQLRADGRAVFGVAPSADRGRRPRHRDRCRRRHARQAAHRTPPPPARPITATTSPSGPPSSSTKPG